MGIMGLSSSAGKDEGSQAGCLMYSPGNLTMKIINIAYERLYKPPQLDDGWPESVEEQGLLWLVWRHHMRKQYIKDVL
jgi:hypothetical protein